MLSLLVASQRSWSVKANRLLVGSQYLTKLSIGKRSFPILTTTTPPPQNLFEHKANAAFHTLTRVAQDDDFIRPPFAASSNNSPLSRQLLHPFQPLQVRWKRKGGASAFAKPRPPTKKQKKKYNRWKKELHFKKVGRHSKPGSKAGVRRAWEKQQHEDLMMHDTPEGQALLDKNVEKHSHYDRYDAMLEDLMGNTSDLTSQSTPTPVYLGKKQHHYFKKVRDSMNAYLQYQQEKQQSDELPRLESGSKEAGKQGSSSIVADLGLEERLLPSDKDISLALRAYRDKYGTKNKPIGISKALEHLLKDLKLPISTFEEWTYNTLLTCCRTPAEAQRVFKMQRDAQHPISAYSWSILVDVHAKLGDYEGCAKVIEEMAAEGVTPTMAAYTSLMAGCYKVCSDGRIPQAVRIQAYEVGWSKWKEMRIIGLDADVMAYGAMLRLCAARGHPERCINLLEEMTQMEVLPTTFCFTTALRAVAKSHETAVRYERGWSKKNRRREQMTLHHGKMARSILILAETAEVEQDDGFVAALMLCAAAAGDSATAKAIYLASAVRKMDHLRSIGSDDHLKRLQGKKVPFDNYGQPSYEERRLQKEMDMQDNLMIENGSRETQRDALGTSSFSLSAPSSNAQPSSVAVDSNGRRRDVASQGFSILTTPKYRKSPHQAFGEREYGKDTRKLNALLHACSTALDSQNGLGTMWTGRDNKGYLCIDSLRLINARRQPKYFDSSIPGIDPVTVGLNAINFDKATEGIENLPARERRARLNNLDLYPDAPLSIYDLDDEASSDLLGIDMKKELEKMKKMEDEKEQRRILRSQKPKQDPVASIASKDKDGEGEEMYFDKDEMKWKTRPRQRGGVVAKVLSTQIAVRDERSLEGLNGSKFTKTPGGTFSAYIDKRAGTRKKASTMKLSKPTSVSSAPTVFNERDEPKEELYFDQDEMSWEAKPKESRRSAGIVANPPTNTAAKFSDPEKEEEMYFDYDEMKWMSRTKAKAPLIPTIVDPASASKEKTVEEEEELYFDSDEMQWKSRPKQKKLQVGIASQGVSKMKNSSVDDLLDGFEMDEKERKQLSKLLKSLDDPEDGADDGNEARDLFEQLQSEYSEEDEAEKSPGSGFFLRSESAKDGDDDSSDSDIDGDDDLQNFLASLEKGGNTKKAKKTSVNKTDELQQFLDSLDLKKSEGTTAVEQGSEEARDEGLQMQPQTQFEHSGSSKSQRGELSASSSTAFLEDFEELASHVGLLHREPNEDNVSTHEYGGNVLDASFREAGERDFPLKQPKSDIEALQMALPGLPLNRIHMIKETFRGTLGNPHMLKLVPLLREIMPEFVTSAWLKQINIQNAYFAFEKAKAAGLVDIHLLNGLLEVEASAGRLDRAIQMYEEEFQKYNVTPTCFSDRLVLQMLVNNNRLPRAFAFKEKIERAGRTLDIQSYGSLMDYYARKEQLGSSMLLLQECLAVHGSPPGEACLTRIRTLCRREDLIKEIGLEDMIGVDPLEWFRDGQANRRRDRSKRGNREVYLPANRMLHI